MIKCVSDIMNNKIATISMWDGISKARRIMAENDVNFLPVTDKGSVVGVLASKDIYRTHPNRIAADAMSSSIISIEPKASIWKAKEEFNRHDVERIPVIDNGKIIGVISRPFLFVELNKHLDILTGLYGRNYIYHSGTEFLKKDIEISVIFIDLDKFGYINKQYGHIKGDNVLKEIGTLLQNNMTDDTYLCRFGGDEFVILTPYMQDECRTFTKELIKTISFYEFSNYMRISASAGVSGGRRKNPRAVDVEATISNLINLASLASTTAKQEKDKLAVAEGFGKWETA